MSDDLKEELRSVRSEFEENFSGDDAALVSHPLNLLHLYRLVLGEFVKVGNSDSSKRGIDSCLVIKFDHKIGLE